MKPMSISAYQYWRAMAKSSGEVSDYHKSSKDAREVMGLMLPTLYPVGSGGIVENPQPGLWKIQVGGGYKNGVKQDKRYLALQIWLINAAGETVHEWSDGLRLAGQIDFKDVTADEIANRWLGCAYLSKKDKDFYQSNGRWPEDPPATITSVTGAALTASVAVPPVAKGSVPGDNSGDAKSFIAMRERIKGEIAESKNHFAKNPIKTKAEADLCENWRKKIWDLMKAADAQREIEKAPHWQKCCEIQDLWVPLIDEAKQGALSLKATADTWINTEQDRLRKEAVAQARAKMEAENRARDIARKSAEEQRAKAAAERAKMQEDDPIAAATGSLPELPELPPEPEPIPDRIIVETPKISIGTIGNRRSAKAAPATATITDLKLAASYYAEQSHPELVALIQKLADKAAKANAKVPGCVMSWDVKKDTAA